VMSRQSRQNRRRLVRGWCRTTGSGATNSMVGKGRASRQLRLPDVLPAAISLIFLMPGGLHS